MLTFRSSLQGPGTRSGYQGKSIYFSKAEICQNIEEFLTTKAHKGAEGRNNVLLHASFVSFVSFVVSFSWKFR
jgi:hypothetical protein